MDSCDIRRELRAQLALMGIIVNDLDQLTQDIDREDPGDIRQTHKGGIDEAMRMRHDFDATLVQAVVNAMRACQGWLNMMRTMFNLSQHLNLI